MDTKRVVRTALTIVVIAIPFGLTVIGGYYGYKKYRDYKGKKDSSKNKE
jgi:hypothetical protein